MYVFVFNFVFVCDASKPTFWLNLVKLSVISGSYTLRTLTSGTDYYAGTDGDVSIDIHGSKGTAAGIVLDNLDKNDRERGQ